ncbi:tRNA uridine-5-carboxymethylaminomethyl(34) synthesis GTPase MnmE [Simiduia sp. 21SJ11W-1]|uniref:tRNA uridine-5-carboxymethylaminomethyl(34) synthesis GTPase MnmE n=1 Tax=Simiduia sp. 21SJ11W-1 TaxID=2909669 RepID=UPI00209FD372|nr:tRNA uridine-5-carboxymethylaminomethyl(34) synthesis GTPase MnmE [Simiduia sp. 21SJ11W-1]UTA47939.1 tRNA uridine-5-carboxymethylaminomethyl(34) synthesis GTPase MnmE [Simiduia sp. 21SJ11W-1]
MHYTKDTIAAIATPIGRGGVGIVRVSGPASTAIAKAIVRSELAPRTAHYGTFYATDKPIDQGIALFFKGPHSFTGEDVLELQGHGGPVVMDWLLQACISAGARMARPGEFSERAFLNDKLDLAQAEAIADLIDANSEQAARNALNSLQGAFSKRVNELLEALTNLRIYVEAAIDFPEEEIDFLSDGHVTGQLSDILARVEKVKAQAQQGALMREGMNVVIAGRPNAGKSSLLNALAGRDSAIVTDIEGTTRDILREHIHIDGMPLHIIDTAGLRDNPDAVEAIGIERALQAIESADQILLVKDPSRPDYTQDTLADLLPGLADRLDPSKITTLINKADLPGQTAGWISESPAVLAISAKSGAGLDLLQAHLKSVMGFHTSTEGSFTARRRHLEAINRCLQHLLDGQQQLNGYGAGELLAEDLRAAQQALGEITGDLSADELLGKIFSSFCIGK